MLPAIGLVSVDIQPQSNLCCHHPHSAKGK